MSQNIREEELDKILGKWLLGYQFDRWTWKHIRDDIQALITKSQVEARIEEVQAYTSDLVCRDAILNEKYILNVILDYETYRIAELKDQLKEGK